MTKQKINGNQDVMGQGNGHPVRGPIVTTGTTYVVKLKVWIEAAKLNWQFSNHIGGCWKKQGGKDHFGAANDYRIMFRLVGSPGWSFDIDVNGPFTIINDKYAGFYHVDSASPDEFTLSVTESTYTDYADLHHSFNLWLMKSGATAPIKLDPDVDNPLRRKRKLRADAGREQK